MDISRYQRTLGSDMDVEFYIEDIYCTRHGILHMNQPIRYATVEVKDQTSNINHYITILGRMFPFEQDGAFLKMNIEQNAYPRMELSMKLLQIGSNRYKVFRQEVVDLERKKFYKIKKLAIRYEKERNYEYDFN